ncbi:hypothetical protein B0T24DRAFT_587422 [Lasiosphaeria ovina]|uniref:Cell wall cysteine-rich protein n=1 Tax=Lasiosphaeria ovina TaxID=92902 RepID=A0AAE0TX08_9PEZI|nr:hypothetical protein B0T24DRAFT_587422 [Lasiosphaeria ovina]
MEDIKPLRKFDDSDEVVCCPPGTVFNGKSCVFIASQICSNGFTLDDATKSVCIGKSPPCPGDLVLRDGLCSPYCPPGFDHKGKQCVSTQKPTCSSDVSYLVVDKTADGLPICGSKNPAECTGGSKLAGVDCISESPPQCPAGYRFEVCRTKKAPICEFGELQDGECRSKELPCAADYKLDSTCGSCVRSTPSSCGEGSKIFFTSPRRQVRSVCFRDVHGMKLDEKDQCSVPAHESQPENGDCVVGTPKCTHDKAVSDPATHECHLTEAPACPTGSTPWGNECISEGGSTCPENYHHSLPDKKYCIHKEQPKCKENARYDPVAQLCVVDVAAPAYPPKTGVLDGLNCVLPSLPVCSDPETTYDQASGHCVSKTRPQCDDGFHIPAGGAWCISNKKPVCEAARDGTVITIVDGVCVSDQAPDCGAESTWVQRLKACVNKKGPCAEGTPDSTTLDKDKVKCITASSRSCFVMLACPDVFDDTVPAIGGGGGSLSPAVGSGSPSSAVSSGPPPSPLLAVGNVGSPSPAVSSDGNGGDSSADDDGRDDPEPYDINQFGP